MLEVRSIWMCEQELELTSELREPSLGGTFLHSDHKLKARDAPGKRKQNTEESVDAWMGGREEGWRDG